MKPVLGVSVYPDMDSIEDISNYLKTASRYGFTRVFSSMFSVEGTKETVLDYFRRLNGTAHEYGMEVSLDVNPECLHRVDASAEDLSVFHEIGCDIIRMDLSFGYEKDLLLLQNPYGIKIEFNASMISDDELHKFSKACQDRDRLLFCHNFYPQPYTGLRWDRFLQMNERVHRYGYRNGAFVSSHAEGSHGVWDAVYGLPTVERLRNLPVDLQARIMYAAGNVTDILIGNAFASEEEMRSLQEAFEEKQMSEDNPFYGIMKKMGASFDISRFPQKKIRVRPVPELTDIERKDLFGFFPHLDFGDSSEWIWRSRGPRMIYAGETFAPRDPGKAVFEPGDVVIVNDRYKHYAGEVHIIRKELPDDGLRNLAGHISEGEQMLLELIGDMDIVIFEEE